MTCLAPRDGYVVRFSLASLVAMTAQGGSDSAHVARCHANVSGIGLAKALLLLRRQADLDSSVSA